MSRLDSLIRFTERVNGAPTNSTIASASAPVTPAVAIDITSHAAAPSAAITTRFQCSICSVSFVHSTNLRRHQRTVHASTSLACTTCGKNFTRKDTLARHMKTHAPSATDTFACPICRKVFPRKDTLAAHIGIYTKPAAEPLVEVSRRRVATPPIASPPAVAATTAAAATPKEEAFGGRMRSFALENTSGHLNIAEFLLSKRGEVRTIVARELASHDLKVNFKIHCIYVKMTLAGAVSEKKAFKSKNATILSSTDVNAHFDAVVEKLLVEASEFQQKESGWALEEILELEVRTNKFNPLRGSSYIDLPANIKAKQAVINVQNRDNECFRWAVLAALHLVDWRVNPERIHHYQPFVSELDFAGTPFPVAIKDIPPFERLKNISVNVYRITGKKSDVYPLHVTENERPHHIDLLYVKTTSTSHYCWVKDLSRLVSAQHSHSTGQQLICRRCLSFFGRADLLATHHKICKTHEAVRVEMPTEENKTIAFKNVQHSLRIPFCVYSDFECLTAPISTCQPSTSTSFTNAYQEHQPMSFCYYIAYAHGPYKPPVVYRGLDAPKVFMERMVQEAKEIAATYKGVVPIRHLTDEEADEQFVARACYVCNGRFSLRNPKIKEHCHITGDYRGPSCNNCNLKLQNPHFLPVFFHNLSGYDAHLFMRELGMDEDPIDLLAENEERYISFSKRVKDGLTLRFLDSFCFMPLGLDALSRNLSRDQFHYIPTFFPPSQVDLVLRKVVYPYDYMSSMDRCAETSLPPKAAFYSHLTETHISDEDYAHAQTVWREFGIKNLGAYSDLYVKTDVLLLADVFENFRKVCLATYGLDAAWYYTAPGLSWDAMLKSTGVSIELLTDYEQLLFVERGIRGSISQCAHRHAKANNQFMEEYDPAVEISYLTYLDANNLYGAATSSSLPRAAFEWAEPLDVTLIPDDSDTGYILEVDLEFPEELHSKFADFPFAAENAIPPGCKEKRLLTTLTSKSNYIIHYQSLKQCLQYGVRLTRIGRVLKFQQSQWLKPYIDLNTLKRTQAVTDFEKNFFKLMVNSVFGKTMQNMRNHVDIRLYNSPKMAEKLVAKSNFSANLAAVHLSKTRVIFNKPITIGMAVLELSKTVMYSFHNGYMAPKYGQDLRLCYQDTDSLVYHVTCENLYEDMKQNLSHFDTSDFPADNPYQMPRVNKKVLGLMKDENFGSIMTEFVGLRAKSYAYTVAGRQPIKKLKGVNKSALKHKITFDDYRRCLLDRTTQATIMNSIRSERHNIYSVQINKLALSSKDEKRFICEDGISTLPYGHVNIR